MPDDGSQRGRPAPGSTHNPLERIANLEHAVLELQRELELLRTQRVVAASEASSTPLETVRARLAEQKEVFGAPPATNERRIGERRNGDGWRPAWHLDDLESLVGRYGMLALGTVAALAAVGTFLVWAVAHGLLGPRTRVVLGVLASVATAVGGHRLRRRERSFGSTLLGLALAMFHVCAWASGPLLRLVPSWFAFAFAAAASVVLAIFAFGEDDEPLWCVGFGGAAIAPFVTSTSGGSAPLLAAYGAIVLLSGCWALQRRAWWVAERVLGLGVGLYVAALASMPERDWGPLLALALPIAIAIIAVILLAPTERARTRLRAMGVLMAAAAVRAGFQSAPPLDRRVLGLLLAAAGVAWLVLVDRAATRSEGGQAADEAGPQSIGDWLDACWLSLAFVVATIAGFDAGRDGAAAALGGAALVLTGFLARRPFGRLRDAAVFGACVCALAGAATVGSESPMPLTVGAAALAITFALGCRVWPSRPWLLMCGVVLVSCSFASLQFLGERVPYGYVPFATRASLVAAAIAVAWGVLAFMAPSVARAFGSAAWGPESNPRYAEHARRAASLVAVTRIATIAWPYAWVNVEVARAFNRSTATLLLITYYAVTAVAAVWLGRRRERAILRHVGLALAIVAALVAFNGARSLDAIAMRIAGYLVAAVFLLGIAYWYRGAGRRHSSAV